ncbi:MAG TPA: hypothetical protein VFO29_07350 [Candidatus Rubrimentiphilum sp.]|nr:hypothetical protein [Candidatus Rubrimentiphilum sp.]
MTMLLAPKPMARTRKGRSVLGSAPRFRKVKAVKVAAHIPALRHPALSLSLHASWHCTRNTTSWSRL